MSRVGIKFQRQESDDAATCNTTRHSTQWMLSGGDDPCSLVGRAMQACRGGQSVGRVPDNLECPGDPTSACCCSTATYALLSACWVCQGHSHKEVKSQITTSYESFFGQCSGHYYLGVAPDMFGLNLPAWTKIQPTDLSEKWDFDGARANASFSTPSSNGESTSTFSYVPTSSTASGSPMTSTPSTSTPSVSASTKSSAPAGTIAASVLGALAAMALFCVGGCFFWRWRRRQRVIQAAQGTKVDLTEPEVHETLPPLHTQQRTATFPYPFEGVVPRHHPGARHSYDPSRSDEPQARPLPPIPLDATPATSGRRFTAPSGDQLMRDLAHLSGSPRPKSKSPWRRRASISTFTYSDYSGSSNSRRAPRQADGQGQYFHLPPSAQYLAEVARYPENVDPDRPWNVRR